MKSKKKKMFYLENVMVYSFRTFYHVGTIHRHNIFDFTNDKNVLIENLDKLPLTVKNICLNNNNNDNVFNYKNRYDSIIRLTS